MNRVLKCIGALSVTLTAVHNAGAQANLPDDRLCRRALEWDRTAWIKDSAYTDEAMRRGLTLDGCRKLAPPQSTTYSPPATTASTNETSDDYHPSFLQAGIFFITGFEQPNIRFLTPESAVGKQQVFYNQSYREVDVSYQLRADTPCTIFGYRLAPPWGALRVEFNNLPSSRAAVYSEGRSPITGTYVAASIAIPHETYCHAKTEPFSDNAGKTMVRLIPGTSMCDTSIVITFNTVRRMKALDYIQANFCPGQPEPPPSPPPPPKPY